jgi:hypothetical protein
LLIYQRPVQLNREIHRNHRVLPLQNDFRFATGLNSAPLACTEFAHAARHYPIVFAGASIDAVVPAALIGLRAGQNLMVDADGHWADGMYVPAFLRRYPFVLAEREEGAGDFTVCLDTAHAGIVEGGEEGEPLFAADGGNSALLDNAMRFLQEYQLHLARTRQFVKTVASHGLLVARQINVQTAEGQSHALDGFHVIDEERLAALKGKAVQELLKSGDLGWIYAHLLSLGNIDRLSRANASLPAPTAPN